MVERLRPVPEEGPFAVYALEKRGLGTPEAVAAMSRRLRVSPSAASFAGLKDAQAETRQHVAVLDGPPQDGEADAVRWRYLGQRPTPLAAEDIVANEFRMVLRELQPGVAAALAGAAAALPPIPNYFDAQRFGSRGESGEFVAAALCRKDRERALWLALAEPNRRDRPNERRIKGILAAEWGDWRDLARLPPPAGPAAATLARRPGDWSAALRVFPTGLQGLWASAFQSWLWNAWLDARIRAAATDVVEFPVGRDRAAAPLDGCPEPWLATVVPYPSARNPEPPADELALLSPTLEGLGLAWRALKIDVPRGACLPKGGRVLAVRPAEVSFTALGPDTARLGFVLPRGAYATIVLAWLAARCGAGA